MGPVQVSNFLTALNVPPVSPNTLRVREKEIGHTLKSYTKETCDEALEREVQLSA